MWLLLIEACHDNNKKPICPRVRYTEGNLATQVPAMGLEFDSKALGCAASKHKKHTSPEPTR